MNDSPLKKTVGIENNGDFISIQAYSGYDSMMADPTATEYFFVADVLNETLGTAVLEAFKQCRLLSYKEACILARETDQLHADWIQKTISRYGYQTRQELFVNMKSCLIEYHGNENVLVFLPSHHEELEVWVGHSVEYENRIKVPYHSSAAEIGATLRLAFNHCTG